MVLHDASGGRPVELGVAELRSSFRTCPVLYADLEEVTGCLLGRHQRRQWVGRTAGCKKSEQRRVRHDVLVVDWFEEKIAPSAGLLEHHLKHMRRRVDIVSIESSSVASHVFYAKAMTITSPLRLAATCMPITQARGKDIEVLMVRRNPELSFGGMWTFPGGVVEEGDGPLPADLDEDTQRWEDPSLLATTAAAAVREAREETSLHCMQGALAWFSHWIPPKVGPPKRFATWFFLAPEHHGDIVVDERENSDARWVTAAEAMDRCRDGDFPMAIPTWITLDDLRQATDISSLMDATVTSGPRWYHTRALDAGEPHPLGQRAVCWPGDAGYDSGDANSPGPRNRVITDDNFAVLERLSADE